MNANFTRLDIPDVILIEPKVYRDERGYFLETYKNSRFEIEGIIGPFSQDNQSFSLEKGVLRGLHYQLDPYAQGKILRVVRGRVFDVAVDIRQGSATCGKWVGEELSGENKRQLWIPPGFAHGFQVLEAETEVVYKTTNEYSPGHEAGIIWNDPTLAVDWPIKKPLLSEKDGLYPTFPKAKNNFHHKGE